MLLQSAWFDRDEMGGEAEFTRVTRAFRALRLCNGQLVRAVSEQEMLQSVCTTLVDVGGYRMAWIGQAEQDTAHTVKPVAAAGDGAGYLKSIEVTWADDEHGRGPTGTAIRTAQPAVNRNTASNPAFAPWREEALRYGFQASAALPIVANGQVLGVISVYSAEADAFDTEECSWLLLFAEDLAFGITSLRARHALSERVKELTALHAAARLLLQSAGAGAERLDMVAELLPPAMQYPAIATGCIRHGEGSHATDGHATTPWMLAAPFQTADGVSGAVEVAYHEAPPGEAAEPFLAEEGELLGSLADMVRVWVDRQDAERAVQAANERLNLAFVTAGMGVWEWDVASNTVRWSEQLSRMTGIEGELDGQLGTHKDLIHPDDFERVFARLERAATGDDDLHGMEFRFRRPDGGWRHMLASARVFREPPARASRVLVAVIDVSERHALEEGLRQAQKVEALGQVAAGVAHDFNNLTSVLMSCVETLRDELPREHAWREVVEDLHTASERARGLTRQLLAFSRKATFHPAALDVCALIAKLEPVLARVAKGSVEMRFELDLEAGRVWADASQLEQVVMNLVVNARDAMPKGGVVTVRTGTKELPASAAAAPLPVHYAVIEVSDTGSGIDPILQKRIFEPFVTTKASGEGTGLGLAVVARVAQQWQGHVEVESVPGRGATFRLLLPQLAD